MSGYYLIVSQMHGLALDVDGGSSAPGARVITWEKHGGANQQWYDDPSTGTIRSKVNNFCLDIEQQGLCIKPHQPGDPNQQWERTGNNIRNRSNTKEVLDIMGSNREPKAPINKYSFNGGPNQSWNFEFVGGQPPVSQRRDFYIVSELNQKVIDIKGANKNPGEHIIMYGKNSQKPKNQLWYSDPQGFIRSALNDLPFQAEGGGNCKTTPYTGDPHQQWMLEGNKIANRAGECLDIVKAGSNDGAEICAYQYKNQPNQHWKAEYV